MRNKNIILKLALIVTAALPATAFAQLGSSINTFSPYTFYGLGDFSVQGPAFLRSMGGAGTAFRSPFRMNYLNPASYSAVSQNSFIFNVGLEGQNFYSKTASAKTSYNTFNIRDIALEFPLWKKIGVGVSVTPLSSVGYRVSMDETDPYILANIGSVTHSYTGDGGVTQVKVGLGIEIFKNFSLGAEMLYYHGKINRSFDMDIDPVLSGMTYFSSRGTSLWQISRVGMNVGLQYNVIANEKRLLTLGATYQPKQNIKPTISREIYTTSPFGDTISYDKNKTNFHLPSSLAVGLFYQTPKIGVGLDYSMQRWSGINPGDELNGIRFENNNSVKAGIQYTPNARDARHFLKRWTYRLGARYNDYYMVVNNHTINDVALTLGIGIPIREQGLSAVNIGVELGQRGTTATGMIDTRAFQMVRERYFKISIGLSLFGEDYWFQKYKYH